MSVAAFGDSLMWGQGIDRSKTFAALFTQLLPALQGVDAANMVWNSSRSGAKISAAAQREEFEHTYPRFFHSATERRNFRNGSDETPASRLYGEVPSAFPTLRGQVAMMSAAMGRSIDVALVDGGINDIAVEDIVNPGVSPGEWIERWDGQIREVGQTLVGDIIGRVRRKCPTAVILYFGFFAPLSHKSSTSKMRDLFEYETDDAVGWFLNDIFGCRDVDGAILEAQTRALWLQGRWQYWTRQAVVAANQDAATRGPGVLYVPSGFIESTAAFTQNTWLWDNYREPFTDDMAATRRKNIPRIKQIDTMDALYDRARQLPPQLPSPAEVRRLRSAIDGPTALRNACDAYANSVTGPNLVELLTQIRAEILRIRHGILASTGHPNRDGARAYADNAVRRFREHREVIKRATTEAQAPAAVPGAPETLDAMLRRYGLRGTREVAADLTHLDVDSLAVRVVNGTTSDPNFFPDVLLVITRKNRTGRTSTVQYQLNFTYTTVPIVGEHWVIKPYPHFEPGATNRLTVDTTGTLRLDEIVGASLLIGDDRLAGKQAWKTKGTRWRPDQVRLEVNGVQVVDLDTRGQAFGFGDSLDLGWPAAKALPASLSAKTVEIKKVRPLPPRPAPGRSRAPQAVAAAAGLQV